MYRYDRNLFLSAEELRQAHDLPDFQVIEELYDSLAIHDKHEIVVNGGMLMKEYELKPGPSLGQVLSAIEWAIVDGELGEWQKIDWRFFEPLSWKRWRRSMSDFIVEKLTKSVGDKTVLKRFLLSFMSWTGLD